MRKFSSLFDSFKPEELLDMRTNDPNKFQQFLQLDSEINLTKNPSLLQQKALLELKTNNPEHYQSLLDLNGDAARATEAAKAAVLPKKSMIMKGLMVGLGVVGVSLAADAIVAYFSKMAKSYESKEYYQKMLEAHPQLVKEDPALVARYWESLYHFAPHMAKDPLAAGAYITQTVGRLSSEQFGGPPPDTFATLADIQKKSVSDKPANDMGTKARQEAVSNIVRNMYL